jgi:glycosyltransferase involved in cell wall biosynthesis
MKVCMLTSGHSYLDNRVFFKEACTLRNSGYEVSLVVPLNHENFFMDPMNNPIRSLYPETSFEENGIRIEGYQKTRRENASSNPDEIRLQVLNDFLRYLDSDEIGDLEVDLIRRGLQHDADIYHAHEISSAYAAIKVKQLKAREGIRVKVVYDVHELFPSLYSDVVAAQDEYREAYRDIIRILEQRFVASSDLVITVSESIRTYLLELHDHPNVHLIKNVPLLRAGEVSGGTETKKFPLVCYEGHIRFERGLKELVEAAAILSARYPEFRLVMVGEATGHEGEYLEQAIREHGLSNNLLVTGWQTPDKAAEWLSQADIGIVFLIDAPYCRVALPNKLFNYMRAGLAIVGIDYPDMGTVIKESGSGTVLKSFSADELVEGLETFLIDRHKLEEARCRSREAYESVYNWNIEGQRLVELYDGL